MTLRPSGSRACRRAARRALIGLAAASLLAVAGPVAIAHAAAKPGGKAAAKSGAADAPPADAKTRPGGKLGGPDAEPPGDALAVTRKVQQRYDETKSFTSDFAQEMRVESGGQVLRSSGKVYFQRPGKMLWSYEKPEPQTIVADGTNLWIYQPEDHQVLKAPLKDAFESRTPVSFLLGVAKIEKDFSPTLLSPADDGSVRLRLVPKDDPQGSLGTLTLELDPVTFDIRAAIIRDSLGNATRVALQDLRRNQRIEASLFRFEVPYGADVVEQPAR
ncbi:MAG TPA: outer membrane lipoprotein chaperone LolA [Candidatus Binatia bacterium]|nr:outer membrane lipoprotein chaperone LolA [Candidatus Binatia bacterium]